MKAFILFLLFFISVFANDNKVLKKDTEIATTVHTELSKLLEQAVFEMNSKQIEQILEFYLESNADINALQVYDGYLKRTIFTSFKFAGEIIHLDMKDFPKDYRKSRNVATSYIYSDKKTIGEIRVFFNNTQKLDQYKKYLLEKKELKLCIIPKSMPFGDFDEDGNHIGLTSDYYNIFSKNLNIPINVVPVKTWTESLHLAKSRACDIISAMKTPKREKYLNFTNPYLKTPVVIATNLKKPFIADFRTLTNEKIGVSKDFAYEGPLRRTYPNIKLVEVSNVKTGLQMVKDGKLYGQFGTLASVGYHFQNEFTGELKISGKTENINLELAIGVRNDDPILYELLQEQINGIDQSFHNKVLNHWINIKYEQVVDYSLFYKFLFAICIIGALILYKQYLLNDMNKKLKEEVRKQVRENRKKDRILFQQSKLAAMGEMLNNIAHQWRQPLNAINSTVAVIDFNLMKEKIQNSKIENSLNDIEAQTRYMSDTIENFRGFFNPDKNKDKFLLSEAIDKALNIVENRIEKHFVEIEIKKLNDKKILGYEGEYIQTLIVILNNAIDAISLNKISNPKIEIVIDNSISIEDNAGGIKSEVIDKIFDPYFTTKHSSSGTGIGLYMSKMIIESSMNGELLVENSNNGTKFTIKI